MGLTVPAINYSSFSTLPLDLSSSSRSSSINIQSKISQLLTKFLKNEQQTIVNNNNNEHLPLTQPSSPIIPSTNEKPSIDEKILAYQYANEKRFNSIKQTNRSTSFSKQQSNNIHLRRLQSKPKLSPISIESKPLISSSIAQRIESLKKSMHNHQLDIIEPIQSPVLSSINFIHKQTQTTDLLLNSCELHHIHHHHIHTSSYCSFSWRICLFLLGFCFLVSIFLIEFITIYF